MARKANSQRPSRRVADREKNSSKSPADEQGDHGPGRTPASGRTDAARRAGESSHSDERGSSWHYYFWALLGLAACGILFLAWLDGLPKRRPGGQRPTAESAAASGPAGAREGTADGTSAKSSSDSGGGPVSSAELQTLVGRWLRQDGGYVLKIKDVSDPAKLEVAYLNPNEIHVARAEATRRGDALQVAIELRDVNYPGCIYELSYDQAGDRLRGTYFQAALGETYDVEFAREP